MENQERELTEGQKKYASEVERVLKVLEPLDPNDKGLQKVRDDKHEITTQMLAFLRDSGATDKKSQLDGTKFKDKFKEINKAKWTRYRVELKKEKLMAMKQGFGKSGYWITPQGIDYLKDEIGE